MRLYIYIINIIYIIYVHAYMLMLLHVPCSNVLEVGFLVLKPQDFSVRGR